MKVMSPRPSSRAMAPAACVSAAACTNRPATMCNRPRLISAPARSSNPPGVADSRSCATAASRSSRAASGWPVRTRINPRATRTAASTSGQDAASSSSVRAFSGRPSSELLYARATRMRARSTGFESGSRSTLRRARWARRSPIAHLPSSLAVRALCHNWAADGSPPDGDSCRMPGFTGPVSQVGPALACWNGPRPWFSCPSRNS